jgi:hypothetical protein
MSNLRRSGVERRLGRQVEKRLHHVEKEPRHFRLAGELFKTKPAETARARSREAKRRLQQVRPVGLGFATEDTYGPDDNWDVVRALNSISYQDYYTGQRTY